MVRHNKDSRQFGRNLRKFRKQNGFMQIDVAVAADVDRTYISRVEAGKARITFNFISKLVKGLEITSNELIAGDDIPYVKNLSYTAEGDDTNNQKIS